ncbi:SNF2-related protein [Bacillus velezensis]|uniref:SNF2-related protein n=1 Tax=Bacillus velezensis TaxID=492670 RepID=UPI001E38898A|nr:SNF2-related protein [Bacillus velezensis]
MTAFKRSDCFNDFRDAFKISKVYQASYKITKSKVMLVLDEADGISNPSSKRTKAVLNCFRRVKYKLLLSATSTRNNIAEAFTAFELLYNNSVNMLCENELIYMQDSETKEIKSVDNQDNYLKPFPAYKKVIRCLNDVMHLKNNCVWYRKAKSRCV